jgi:hypothetical protein
VTTDLVALRAQQVAQVAQEAQEIANAALVINTALVQRCHFCGQLTDSGTEIFGPAHSEQTSQMRFKGRCCGG